MQKNREKKAQTRASYLRIQLDPPGFIAQAQRDFKEIESTYRSKRYRIIQRCAIAVEFAKENKDFRHFVRETEFWTKSREKPSTKYSAKWCTFLILDPQNLQERATAGRYAAIIEFLLGEGVPTDAVAAALKERGGIDKTYSASVRQKLEALTEKSITADDVDHNGNDDEEAEGNDTPVKSQNDANKAEFNFKWSDRIGVEKMRHNGDKILTVRVTGMPSARKTVEVVDVLEL